MNCLEADPRLLGRTTLSTLAIWRYDSSQKAKEEYALKEDVSGDEPVSQPEMNSTCVGEVVAMQALFFLLLLLLFIMSLTPTPPNLLFSFSRWFALFCPEYVHDMTKEKPFLLLSIHRMIFFLAH